MKVAGVFIPFERIKMPKRRGELGFSKKLIAKIKSYKPKFTPSAY
jgi:hypothetical protein